MDCFEKRIVSKKNSQILQLSKPALGFDVYCSSTKKICKSGTLELDSVVEDYSIHYLEGEGSGRALIYLSRKKGNDLLSFQETKDFIIEKYSVFNLLKADEEIEFKKLKSMEVTNCIEKVHFNPEAQEIALIQMVNQEPQINTRNPLESDFEPRSELRIYNQDFELDYKLDIPLVQNRVHPIDSFSWVGEGKCWVGVLGEDVGGENLIFYLLVKIKSKIFFQIFF